MEKQSQDTWALMARALGGEATADEIRKLQAILAEDMHLNQQYELLSRVWQQENSEIDELDAEAPGSEVQRIIRLAEEQFDLAEGNDKMPKRPVQFNNRKLFIGIISLAASLLIAVTGYKFIFSNSNSKPQIVSQVLVANNGTRSRNILPDGSVVWLNAGSKLTLSGYFKKKDRNVTLEGEAYFEVVKNPFPFIVHAGGINIKVVGTAFTVKSYPKEKNVEATLFHGSIKLSRQGDTIHEITLRPHEKFIISRKEILPINKGVPIPEIKGIISLLADKPEEEQNEKAWVFNRLVFRGDDFETLAEKLERWYDVQIQFTDPEVRKLRFNGSFEEETIEQALNALQLASSFSYKINDHEILIGSY